ncbi:MAG: DEAD/DEAH box helicase [Candidatus Sericytochromatia bacterium]|nr:DEAD/DEAH box helicase [Candidatus Tanganyikabacteria bacterium]
MGASALAPDGTPDCLIVDTGHRRRLDLSVWTPQQELGPIATHELWGEALDEVARLAKARRTTLVFVNTRRLAERVAFQLSQRLGAEQVVAHHGSLSRETRLAAEARLKAADVKVCVATASLELGIDIGEIDLVVLIGATRSLSTFLQRVGRSGHGVGAVPRARVFPLTRDDLAGVAAGDLDRLCIPAWPLDVLAQQLVAACGTQEWRVADLWDLARRAYPYRDLPRNAFDQVVATLADGVSGRAGRSTAYLHLDGINGRVRGRRAARLVALTNGGAIPENADYEVVMHGSGLRVGTVNEDFAVESMAGDIFQLGNTSWQIVRVEAGRVRVEDAGGAPPSIPFWLGEAPGRTAEVSTHVWRLREELFQRLRDRKEAIDWLIADTGLDAAAAELLVAYVEEGVRVLGAVPTARRLIAERFFDESGGMQLVIHAPLGSRINRAWGMALRKKFCRTFDFELQASATDDGINLSLGPQHSFPLADIFGFLKAARAREVLEQAVLQAPLFGIRWRHAATRSLFVLRHQGGRKVPPPLQRMRADDLLASVFPAQAGCQDNRAPGNVELPDHPLVFEAMRDCLHEFLDVDGLVRVLEDIEQGRIDVIGRDTPQPSVFAHQLLNAMPYAFLDDAPLEERRARSVALRRALPERVADLGRLDPEAIAAAAEDAWPAHRDGDELHDALLTLGAFPADLAGPDEATWFRDLQAAGRVLARQVGDRGVWFAAERPDPAPEEIVRGWCECSGPLSVADLARRTALPEATVRQAVAALEGSGAILVGRFTPGRDCDEVCDRRILARIHRATIGRLRREIEPVPPAAYLDFLFAWQHAAPDARTNGPDGLLLVIELLAGYESAAPAWEEAIFPLRVRDYSPAQLDRLALGGEVVWGRFSRRPAGAGDAGRRAGITRAVPIAFGLRTDLPWLLASPAAPAAGLSSVAAEILERLTARGALFHAELAAHLGVLPAQVDDAIGQLVAAGLVTSDGFAALRRLAPRATAPRDERRSLFSRGRRFPTPAGGRWALLAAAPLPDPEALEQRAAQLLRRYGILVREVLVREPQAPPWRDLLAILRRAEARGEIRGGRFVAGLVGEQFALPEAIDALRAGRRDPRAPAGPIRLAATDPLNLSGILLPGPRIPALPGTWCNYADGRFETALARPVKRLSARA